MLRHQMMLVLGGGWRKRLEWSSHFTSWTSDAEWRLEWKPDKARRFDGKRYGQWPVAGSVGRLRGGGAASQTTLKISPTNVNFQGGWRGRPTRLIIPLFPPLVPIGRVVPSSFSSSCINLQVGPSDPSAPSAFNSELTRRRRATRLILILIFYSFILKSTVFILFLFFPQKYGVK